MDAENSYEDSFQQMTFAIATYLENKIGVTSVQLDKKKPVDSHAIYKWEQKYCCFLPTDLKNFYLTCDGIQLVWLVKIDNDAVPLGRMYVHPIGKVSRLMKKTMSSSWKPQKDYLEWDQESKNSGFSSPAFNERCHIFELDSCDGIGKVCLVYIDISISGYSNPRTEIWFLDLSLKWHFLAPSFMSYYRLMLVHLGLPQWQYIFTDIGLSPQARQWLNLYAPSRLHGEPSVDKSITQKEVNLIDVGKLFKARSDRRKHGIIQGGQSVKKKPIFGNSRRLQKDESSPPHEKLEKF